MIFFFFQYGCFDGLKEEMNKIGYIIQKEFDVVGYKFILEIYQYMYVFVFVCW